MNYYFGEFQLRVLGHCGLLTVLGLAIIVPSDRFQLYCQRDAAQIA